MHSTSNSADITSSTYVPRGTTAGFHPYLTHEFDTPSWRHSSRCQDLVKEITLYRTSPWIEALKGFKLERLEIRPSRPTQNLLAFFTRPEEQRKATSDKTIWVIDFERSFETTHSLSSRVPASIAAEDRLAHRNRYIPFTEATRQSSDTTIRPKYTATLNCLGVHDRVYLTELRPNGPKLWEYKLSNNLGSNRPDVTEFFLAMDVILSNPNPEVYTLHPHRLLLLTASLIERFYAQDTYEPSTSAQPVVHINEYIPDNEYEEYRYLFGPLLSGLRRSYEQRLTRDRNDWHLWEKDFSV